MKNMKNNYFALLAISGLFVASSSYAEIPCDFKGVSVGDKMSTAQIMAAFKIAKYKINPKRRSFEERAPDDIKYGITASAEREDWNIGPYCDDHSCNIPYGIGIGNNSGIPTTVYVAFSNGQITEIDVSFNSLFWEDFVPILHKKFGSDWEVENTDLTIMNYETKATRNVYRVFMTNRKNGKNVKTNDSCEMWATNYDVVFEHHDPLGIFHSSFAIKLISTNF